MRLGWAGVVAWRLCVLCRLKRQKSFRTGRAWEWRRRGLFTRLGLGSQARFPSVGCTVKSKGRAVIFNNKKGAPPARARPSRRLSEGGAPRVLHAPPTGCVSERALRVAVESLHSDTPSEARAARTLCCDDVNAERAPRDSQFRCDAQRALWHAPVRRSSWICRPSGDSWASLQRKAMPVHSTYSAACTTTAKAGR